MLHQKNCLVRRQRLLLALAIFVVFAGTSSGQAIVSNIPVSGIFNDNSSNGISKFAINPTTNRAYVVTEIIVWDGGHDSRRRTIQVVDLATHAAIASIDAGEQILKIVVNPTTNRVYALEESSYQDFIHVIVIGGDTNQVLTRILVPENTCDLAVNPVTNRIYGVQGFTDESVSPSVQKLQAFVIDGATNTVIGGTAFYPHHWGYGIAVNPVTNRFYVLNTTGDDGLLVFNGETNELEKSVSNAALHVNGVVQMDLNPNAGKLFILSNRGEGPLWSTAVLAVVDVNTNEPISILPIGNSQGVRDFAVNSTTNRVYVVHGPYCCSPGAYYVLAEFDGNTNSSVSRTILLNDAAQVDTLGIAVNSQTNRLFINRKKFLSVFDPVDATPPYLFVSDSTVEATSSAGASAYYSAYASDNSNVSPAIECSIPSGSTFPIGTTTVTCRAVDASGNQSAPQSFAVHVVDTTGPNLTLPDTIFTDAVNAFGAVVNYVASASDAVDGDRPITCSPTSGATFPVGETVVNCAATDAKGNSTSSTFRVFVLGSNEEATATGDDVTVHSSDSGLTLTYYYVDQPGVTTIAPIDPGTIGETPSGFAVSGIAYEIHTTSAGAADNGVSLSFVVPNSATMSQAEFESLRVLHNTKGTLEDVTNGHDYANRTVFAYTYSFSPFYLVRSVETKIETLFDRSTPYKVGSTIPIKIQIRNRGTNANLSSSSLKVTARSLKRLGSSAASLTVIDSGAANPDSNFRYLGNSIGGTYIFNLSTKTLSAGSYALSFYVGDDRSVFYTVKFEVK